MNFFVEQLLSQMGLKLNHIVSIQSGCQQSFAQCVLLPKMREKKHFQLANLPLKICPNLRPNVGSSEQDRRSGISNCPNRFLKSKRLISETFSESPSYAGRGRQTRFVTHETIWRTVSLVSPRWQSHFVTSCRDLPNWKTPPSVMQRIVLKSAVAIVYVNISKLEKGLYRMFSSFIINYNIIANY